MAALRAEAAAAEQRLEEERAAHAEARRSFVAREAELEAGLAESAAALSGMQRSLDDRARRCEAAEQRAVSAEQRADALAQSLASHQAELTTRSVAFGSLLPCPPKNRITCIAMCLLNCWQQSVW